MNILLHSVRKWRSSPIGAVVYKCTENLYARKAKQYPAYYGFSRIARYRDDIAKKKVCAD